MLQQKNDKYNVVNLDDKNRKAIELYQKKRVPKKCIKCGDPLPHNSQKICTECLLKMYASDDQKTHNIAAGIFSSRSYCAAEVKKMLKDRGIKMSNKVTTHDHHEIEYKHLNDLIKKTMPRAEFAAKIDVSYMTLLNKLQGKTPWNIRDIIAIKSIFPNESIETIFNI